MSYHQLSDRGRRDPMDVRFTWDEEKAAGNLLKHGVSFEEAAVYRRMQPLRAAPTAELSR